MSQKTFKINSSRRQISLHEEQKRRYNQGNVGRGGDGEAYKRKGEGGNHCCHLFGCPEYDYSSQS